MHEPKQLTKRYDQSSWALVQETENNKRLFGKELYCWKKEARKKKQIIYINLVLSQDAISKHIVVDPPCGWMGARHLYSYIPSLVRSRIRQVDNQKGKNCLGVGQETNPL